MRRLVLIATIPGFLAGCMGPPPPTTRQLAADPAAVEQRLRTKLAKLGFTVATGSGGTISAQSAAGLDKFATCDLIVVGQSHEGGGGQLEKANSADVDVTATVTPAGASSIVALDVRYTGHYFSFATGYPLERPCHSNGMLEPLLLSAAG